MSKSEYQTPHLNEVGTFEALTQGAQGSTKSDKIFPINPNHPFS